MSVWSAILILFFALGLLWGGRRRGYPTYHPVEFHNQNYGTQTIVFSGPPAPVVRPRRAAVPEKIVFGPKPELTREERLRFDVERQHAATLRGDGLLGTYGRYPPTEYRKLVDGVFGKET